MTAAAFINDFSGANAKDVAVIGAGNARVLPFRPGTYARGDQGSDWVYVAAGAGFSTGTAVVDGQVVTFDNTFTATLLANAAASGKIGQLVGVIRFAGTIAQNNGFWVQVRGQANVFGVASAGTAYTKLNSSATAGAITSTVSAGTNFAISGIYLNAAVGGANGSVEGTLNYPQITAAN